MACLNPLAQMTDSIKTNVRPPCSVYYFAFNHQTIELHCRARGPQALPEWIRGATAAAVHRAAEEKGGGRPRAAEQRLSQLPALHLHLQGNTEYALAPPRASKRRS